MFDDYAKQSFLRGQKVEPREKRVAVVDAYNDPELLRIRLRLVERKRNEILIRASDDVRRCDQTLEQLKTQLGQDNAMTLN